MLGYVLDDNPLWFCEYVMEARKLATFDDLLAAWRNDERLELINGEIVKRSAPRAEHGAAQLDIGTELAPYRKKSGMGGWWIMAEISVRYNEHQAPIHDLAGWRKERVSERPTGVMGIAPDWVGEITSPGHEKKDYLDVFMILQKHQVPYYWIISPEDQSLLAYKLVNGKYSVIETAQGTSGKIRIEPFLEVEFDLRELFDH